MGRRTKPQSKRFPHRPSSSRHPLQRYVSSSPSPAPSSPSNACHSQSTTADARRPTRRPPTTTLRRHRRGSPRARWERRRHPALHCAAFLSSAAPFEREHCTRKRTVRGPTAPPSFAMRCGNSLAVSRTSLRKLCCYCTYVDRYILLSLIVAEASLGCCWRRRRRTRQAANRERARPRKHFVRTAANNTIQRTSC